MTSAYLGAAELVDDGEIGAEAAAAIVAMLAEGIVSQLPLPAITGT
jgi:lysozyme family protein